MQFSGKNISPPKVDWAESSYAYGPNLKQFKRSENNSELRYTKSYVFSWQGVRSHPHTLYVYATGLAASLPSPPEAGDKC